MIFIAKNEKGIPSWKLVQDGDKTVTRRFKPLPVGKEFAVQPGRGKFAVCRGKVISCVPHIDWFAFTPISEDMLMDEANKEGFKSWRGFRGWFNKKGINLFATYRIEFELIEENKNGIR